LKSNELYAYVTKDSSPIIYVNTTHTNLDPQSITEIFIHEVQHLLYFYQPLNPTIKIEDCFTTKTYVKGGVFQKLKNLFNTTKRQTNKVFNNISSVLKNT
jgi:hypothetical protein